MGAPLGADVNPKVAIQGTVDTTGFLEISYEEFNKRDQIIADEVAKLNLSGNKSKEKLKELRSQYWTERLAGYPGAVLDYTGPGDHGPLVLVTEAGIDRIGDDFRVVGTVVKKPPTDPSFNVEGSNGPWRIDPAIPTSVTHTSFQIAEKGLRKVGRYAMKAVPIAGTAAGLSSAAQAAQDGNYETAALDIFGLVYEPLDTARLLLVIAEEFGPTLLPSDPTQRNPDGTYHSPDGQLMLGPGPKY
jgi:FtsZ-binding cell division protein ZapB